MTMMRQAYHQVSNREGGTGVSSQEQHGITFRPYQNAGGASATTRRARKRPAASVAIQRRPAAAKTRKPKPFELCAGRAPLQPCIYSTTEMKGRARIHGERGKIRCVFCDDERMAAIAHDKRGTLTRHLRAFATKNSEAYEQAFDIIERVLGQDHAAKLRKVVSTRKARGKAAPKKAAVEVWADALQHRQSTTAAPTVEEVGELQKWTTDDKRRRDRKFKSVFTAEDDWMSEKAKSFLHWCKFNSWFMCSHCHRLETRRLEPSDIAKNTKLLPGTK
eukprot:6342684-Amphidinium_carterae.1